MVWLIVAGLIAVTLLTFVMTIAQLDLSRRYWLSVLRKDCQREVPPLPESLPRVTIQLPIYNESPVVHRLLEAASRIDYPHDLLQIQVLDDSTDDCSKILVEKVAEIQQRDPSLNIQYRHRIDRTGYKAGNLDEGTTWATGEFMAIFDADFVPKPDYLQQTIRYFQNEEIAIVQSRWGHLNPDSSIVTRVQQFFLDGHLSVEQRGRGDSDLFLIYNGSAGIWRKQVIVDCGGWMTTAAIEDVDMSYRAQLRGKKIVYLEDYTTPGELPDSMIALRLQLFRWWKGNLQIAIKYIRQVWQSDYPLIKKLHATTHLFGPLMSAVTFANIILAGAVPLIVTWYPETRYWLASTLLGVALIPVLFLVYGTGRIRFGEGSLWQKILGIIPLGSMLMVLHSGLSCQHTVSAFEAFFVKKNVWVVTPKGFSSTGTSQAKRRRIKIPWYFWLDALVIIYLIGCGWMALMFQFYMIAALQVLWICGFLWVLGGSLWEANKDQRAFSLSSTQKDRLENTAAELTPGPLESASLAS